MRTARRTVPTYQVCGDLVTDARSGSGVIARREGNAEKGLTQSVSGRQPQGSRETPAAIRKPLFWVAETATN